MEILPGILATDEAEYQKLVEVIGHADALSGGWVQLDIMDGEFVNNTSVGVEVIKKYPIGLYMEAHLMVNDPVKWVRALADERVRRFIAPVELGQTKIAAFLEATKELGVKSGLSINPQTEYGLVRAWIDQVETVLVMSVEPGYGGQEFLESSYKKVEDLRKMSKNVRIEVDGGVDPVIAGKLTLMGADAVVLGASRLIEKGIDDTLEEIWEITTAA